MPGDPISPTHTSAALPTAAGPAAAGFAPGTILAGRFRIVALVGRGGMGEVYRADDLRLGQPVALKFLPEPLDEQKLTRFYGEVRLGRQVAHPNVCRIYDVLEDAGRQFAVMEYVDGEDLQSLLRRVGRFSPDKALEIARGLCAGVSAAHDKGILHRDLKPANVMLDGRGQARVTDFGLAVLSGQAREDAVAGTPAYMAPEQLRGEDLTPATDVYSLGLVLHEVFTGRRVWDAGTLSELLKLRSEPHPAAPSRHVPDLDPVVDRVIQRCLETDPAARPATAHAVLAALPGGGDPLQAAVELGETPSPEMVAAAGVVGTLRPPVAWAALLAVAVALCAVVGLSDQVMLHRLVPLPKSAEVLLDRARGLADRLTPGEPVVDSAWGFEADLARIRGIAAQDRTPRRWERLAEERPGPVLFWYRTSRQPLVARTWELRLGYGARDVGRVTREQPPPVQAGMQEIVLDTHGRLVRWERVPAPEDALRHPAATTWLWLSGEAGMDAGTDDLRVETVDDSRIKGFSVSRRDAEPGPAPAQRVLPPWAMAAGASAVLLLATGMIVLATRNLRLGRGDRRGALRLFVFGLVSGTVAVLLRLHLPPSFVDAADLSMACLGQALYWAASGWLLYIALEPLLRRTWPHLLISWSRLLSGRFKDPLVGRDVLLGTAAGTLLAALGLGGDLVPRLLGRPQLTPFTQAIPVLGSTRDGLAVLIGGLYPAAYRGAALLLVLLLLYRLSGRRSVAGAIVFGMLLLTAIPGEDPLGGLPMAALRCAVGVTVVLRLGALSIAVMTWVQWVLFRLPLAADVSAWYAPASHLGLAIVAAVAVYGFVVALAGQPLFGRPLFDPDPAPSAT
jgi:serine/threonine-protein kinase